MAFAVGTNFDPALVEGLSDFPEVTDLYGCLPRHVVGHVRPYPNLRKITREELAEHVDLVHASGRTFTYLLNAPSMGGRQFDTRRRLIFEHLDWLSRVGVDTIATALPDLITLVKREYPHFRVKASHMAFINRVEQAQMYEDLGADIITVHASINRRFSLLKEVVDSVSIPIQIIVTGLCAKGCPNRVSYHACITSEISSGRAEANEHNRHGTGYCFSFCHLKKLERPELILMGGVRPEDIHHFEDLGVTHFKLDSRVLKTDQILDRVRAWHDRRWTGDLKRLMSVFSLGYRTWQDVQMGTGAEAITDVNDPVAAFYNLAGEIDFSKLPVDNAAADGVFEFFLNETCPPACAGCDHCTQFADKAINWDPQVRARFIKILKDYRGWLMTRG